MKLLCRGAVFTWDDCDYFAGKELKKKEEKNEFSIRGEVSSQCERRKICCQK